jgi:hypothetical protein
VVFLDIEKAFDITWHSGLLYKLAKFEFSTRLIQLISSFLSERKFRVSVEGEMSTPREMQVGVPQGSVLSPTLYNIYVNDPPHTPGVYLALFAEDTCLYTTDRKEGLIVRKLAWPQLNGSLVCAGISKLRKTRHRESTSLTAYDRMCLVLH